MPDSAGTAGFSIELGQQRNKEGSNPTQLVSMGLRQGRHELPGFRRQAKRHDPAIVGAPDSLDEAKRLQPVREA